MKTIFIQANTLLHTLEGNSTTSLQERMINAYEKKALIEFLACFTDNGSLDREKMLHFLLDNWERTRFSCISYTARPDSPFTDLLCRTAKEWMIVPMVINF